MKPSRCLSRCTAGNTEGKILATARFPVTTQGLRPLDALLGAHKTPALTMSVDIASYISGFVDGEGCFCVSFQPSRRHRLGWEVRPSFSVSQNADRAQLLYRMQELWGCGFIRPDRSDKTLKYEVRNVQDLVQRVLPHFQTFPLLSPKQDDVVRFNEICRIVGEGGHTQLDGFECIVRTAMQMNPSGKRKYAEDEILNSLRSGEGIVCATGNGGVT